MRRNRTNGAGGNRTPEHSRNLRENTPIPTSAQRRAQRRPHRGRNEAQDPVERAARQGDQSRPHRGRWQGAAAPRPTPTWPASWRRGPTCRPTCVPGSSRRSARPRPPAEPRPTPDSTDETRDAATRRAIAARSVGGNGGMVPSHRARRSDAMIWQSNPTDPPSSLSTLPKQTQSMPRLFPRAFRAGTRTRDCVPQPPLPTPSSTSLLASCASCG